MITNEANCQKRVQCLQAYEEAGIQVQSVKALPSINSSTSSAEVTLNALNAGESEVDLDTETGLGEFGGSGSQVR